MAENETSPQIAAIKVRCNCEGWSIALEKYFDGITYYQNIFLSQKQ